MRKSIVFALLVALLVPSLALARIGVGVGTGKIALDKDLQPGGIYELPVLTVLNTGDEPSNYGVRITYHSDQQEIWPDREWFSFEPEEFYLAPGEAQIVDIKLSVPFKTVPGNYFAFLEGYPIQEDVGGGVTSVKVAAAAKLYFTVAASNIFEAAYYRTITFFNNNAPWSYIVLAVVIMAILITLFKKKFNFKLKLDIDKK